jgi:hypothetical protein
LITLLTEALRAVVPGLVGHASAEYEIIAFGIILMLVMIFMPQGVVQGAVDIYKRRRPGKGTAMQVGDKDTRGLPALRRRFGLSSWGGHIERDDTAGP